MSLVLKAVKGVCVPAALVLVLVSSAASRGSTVGQQSSSVLEAHFLIAWYGNPRSARMGILGERSGRIDQRACVNRPPPIPD